MATPKRDLQAELTAVTAKINQLKGREAAALARLESEFGYTTVEQAEDALKEAETEARELQEQYDTEYTKFMDAWGDKLGTL